MSFGLNWAMQSRLKRKPGVKNYNSSGEPVYMGEDKEHLVLFAKDYMKTHTDIDFFIFGHRHIELDLMLSRAEWEAAKDEIRKKVADALELVQISNLAKRKPNELSGGEKQRVAVARALMNHPGVIMADEPSGSLDSRNKEELHRLFFELRDKMGQTFVIVTHDETLASISDRTIHMKDGQIISENTNSISQEPSEVNCEDKENTDL